MDLFDQVTNLLDCFEADVVGDRKCDRSCGQYLTVASVSSDSAARRESVIGGNTWHPVGAAMDVLGPQDLTQVLSPQSKLSGVDSDAYLVMVRSLASWDLLQGDTRDLGKKFAVLPSSRTSHLESFGK